MRWVQGITTALGVLGVLSNQSGRPTDDDYASYQADYSNDYSNDYEENRESANRNIEKVQTRQPKFVTTTKIMMINDGATVKLPCEVDQLEGFILIWKKERDILSMGEKILKLDARIKVEGHANGNSLIISLAGPADAGVYSCQISSPGSKSLNHTVNIRVAPVVSASPARLEVAAGQSAVLKCTAEQGDPKPVLYWTRQGKLFRSGESKLTGATLELTGVSREDAGLYTCHGDNEWIQPANSTMQLQVLHKPEIEQQEMYIQTHDGAEVEVTCTVHAAPPATVEWYMNGKLLDPSKNVISNDGNVHKLYLGVGTRHTHGKYMCRAINRLGEAARMIEVSGRARPAAFRSPLDGPDHDRFLLAWTTQSNSSAVDMFVVQYRQLNGHMDKWTTEYVIPKQTQTYLFEGELLLEQLSPGTEYVAKVESKNIYGWTEHHHAFKFRTKSLGPKPKHDPLLSLSKGAVNQPLQASGSTKPVLSYLLLILLGSIAARG